MNKEIIETEIERMEVRQRLTDDYIEGKILEAQIAILRIVLDACNQ